MTETALLQFDLIRVDHIVDGDTFDAVVRDNDVGTIDGWALTGTKKVRIRLVHLDTPERGEPGYHEATVDLDAWLSHDELRWAGLRVVTSGKDSFGRYLADVYSADDRAATASDYMLREANNGTGWPVWLPPSLRPPTAVNGRLTLARREEHYPMTDPAEPVSLPLEANLGIATDEEWLDAHAALTDLLDGTGFPMEELTFIWDPALPASSLIDPDAVDHGPSYADPEEPTDGPA